MDLFAGDFSKPLLQTYMHTALCGL